MTPSQASSRIARIAAAVDAASRPSLRKLSEEIGKVVLALEHEGVAEPEGSREGLPAVPDGQLIAHLQKWLTAKYRIDAAYRSFSDRVKGPWRDSLVDHWYEHAKEERSQGYDIAMKIVGLGGDPSVTVLEVPQCPPAVQAFCATLVELELEAIERARETISMAGDLASLRVMAENVLLVDTQHLDDLRRMCAGM